MNKIITVFFVCLVFFVYLVFSRSYSYNPMYMITINLTEGCGSMVSSPVFVGSTVNYHINLLLFEKEPQIKLKKV